ncbi:hypothetical protein HYALB_00008128 [Hymenoscyphus albidus]|uniref:Heterokaryon incompatibility domain-containing protein n=1 Tax=Hymenoscyphus albidus TaxID=595503 RepID=A0A9N9LE81_9HELO|nr:hypothetical protein HYALB_00008128 [Hymenoscyphus albidus]
MYILKSLSLLRVAAVLSRISAALPQAQAKAARDTAPCVACGKIVNSPEYTFPASLAYECLTSVPFNPAVAVRFLDYFNDTLQFQSTLSYLKNPPTSYQQPAVDLLKGLEDLKKGIEGGIFPNQYEFEAVLQALLLASHDGHLTLDAGILAAFRFASPYDLVTLSKDGIQTPKVYLTHDFAQSNAFINYTLSAVASINGEDNFSYPKRFATKNAIGLVEQHADWNSLMRSAAQDNQGDINIFGGRVTFYFGDTVTFVLENGTQIHDDCIAIYYSPGNAGPLETGGDFYNYFVLGILPDSYEDYLVDNNTHNITTPADEMSLETSSDPLPTTDPDTPVSATSDDSSPAPTCAGSFNNAAYPTCPNISQEWGYTGYFLNDSSIAVLVLPTFDYDGKAIDSFDLTIANFLKQSRSAILEKVVIDLQQDSGGQSLLAIAAFRHFFPNIDPYVGSRMRAHPAAYVMGKSINDIFVDIINGPDPSTTADDETTDEDAITLKEILYADEFVSSERINANTGKLFSNWDAFFGPNATTLDDQDAVVDDLEPDYTVFGYGSNIPQSTIPPYAAEDIIILSDRLCSSACTLFMEMMHHEAGVRVVVVGGQPINGPMQAASGTRGAAVYTIDTLDAHTELARFILNLRNDSDADFLPNRTEERGFSINSASINLRDQFAYEAADCRIWYTPQTFYNYTALWKYASDSIWGSKNLCVSGSKGYAATGSNKTDFVGPESSSSISTVTVKDIVSHLTIDGTVKVPYLNDGLDDLPPNQQTTVMSPSSQDELHRYIYTPLPGNTRSIRVLSIDSKPGETIRCSFRVLNLDNKPIYDCLSYTWAHPLYQAIWREDDRRIIDDSPTELIKCEGKAFKVAENLYEALKQLCKKKWSLDEHGYSGQNCIWIDAICINQKDDVEKKPQLEMMKDIYCGAENVIAWLGPDSDDPEAARLGVAIDVLERLASIPPSRRNVYLPDNLFDGSIWDTLGMEPIFEEEWLHFAAFILRSWFSRIWVVQE